MHQVGNPWALFFLFPSFFFSKLSVCKGRSERRRSYIAIEEKKYLAIEEDLSPWIDRWINFFFLLTITQHILSR